MASRSNRTVSNKPVEATQLPELLDWMNRELIPVVRQLREAFNALATEVRDGIIVVGEPGTAANTIVMQWAAGAPTGVAADGSFYTDTTNGDFYVKQAGFWVLK